MNYIKQNISYLRKKAGLNQGELGNELQYTRDNIASYERGTEPKIDFIQKIVNYFHIDIESFINTDLSIPREVPKKIEKFTNSLQMPKVVTIDSFGNNNIALVNVRARAGYLNGYGDAEFIEKLPSYNLPGLGNKTLRAFELEGNSMNPTLHNRDIVFAEWVEGIDFIREDRVHVLVTKTEGVVIKRLLNRVNQYGYIIAKSDAINQRNEYPNIHIPAEDISEIWYPKMYLSADFRSPSDMWQRMNNFESDLEEIKRQLSIKPIH